MMLYFLLSCTQTEPTITIEANSSPPNIVFITMDTTRRDRLGTYGYAQGKTDRIDAFAEHGYRFENAYSSIPLTTPSHASMLTGLYPPHHGIRNNGDAILPDAIETLPERLKAHGYQNVAAVSAFVTTRIWNLHQGFDFYFDDIAVQEGGRWAQERFAESVMDDLSTWWETSRDPNKPFMMWAHLYDPHHPHVVHNGYESIENTYDAEIAYMDDQIDRLYQRISQEAPNTIWVLIADHGEAFEGQHGESSHGLFLYDETMRIPWIIQPYPVLPSTTSIETPTSVVDVSNTILALLDLPILEDVDGINALETNRTEPVYMESNTVQQRFGYHPEIALSDGQTKLMPTATPHLYNLVEDPMETTNLWNPSKVEDWSAWTNIGRNLYMDTPRFTMDAPDASVMKQLEALGYMGGANGDRHNLEDFEMDAKDRLQTIERLTTILKAKKHDPTLTPEQVITQFEELLLNEPQLAEARLLLGQTYAVAGRKDDAVRTFEEALSLNPTSVVIGLNLANLLADLNRFDEGIAILDGILERVPKDKSAQSNILRMLSDSGKHKEAIERGSDWLADTPSTQLQAILGVILVRDQQLILGEEMLRASLADQIPREHVHRSLGHIALTKQDVSSTLQEYELELKHFNDPTLRARLAKLYEGNKDWLNASKHHCILSKEHPKGVRMHLNCAQTLFNLGEIDAAKNALAPAIQLAPEGPFVLLLAANIAAKEGREVEAKQLFERAQTARLKQVEAERPTE